MVILQNHWMHEENDRRLPRRVVGYFLSFLSSISNFLPDTLIVIKTGGCLGTKKNWGIREAQSLYFSSSSLISVYFSFRSCLLSVLPLIDNSLEEDRATSSLLSLELCSDITELRTFVFRGAENKSEN